jgi:hypothetical protein
MKAPAQAPAGHISKSDLESKLRALQGGVEESIQSRRQQLLAGGAAIAAVILIITFLLGRRAGRRKSAVIEIRRF